MLSADKQLLDATLRNELQQLRRMEINNVVNRFQNALTPSTLISGFTVSAMAKMMILPPKDDHTDDLSWLPMGNRNIQPLFYLSAITALALALYVVAVASMGIIFGQRLQVQANEQQGQQHTHHVREMNNKFVSCLIALGVSMICVVLGALAGTPRYTPPSCALRKRAAS